MISTINSAEKFLCGPEELFTPGQLPVTSCPQVLSEVSWLPDDQHNVIIATREIIVWAFWIVGVASYFKKKKKSNGPHQYNLMWPLQQVVLLTSRHWWYKQTIPRIVNFLSDQNHLNTHHVVILTPELARTRFWREFDGSISPGVYKI